MVYSSHSDHTLGNLNKLPNTAADILAAANIHLTTRELEILKLVIFGHGAKKIGLLLKISNRTVEKYIENLKNKFNCRKKTELIFMFLDNHLLKEKILQN